MFGLGLSLGFNSQAYKLMLAAVGLERRGSPKYKSLNK